MTNSEKAQQVFRALNALRGEYAAEGKTRAAGVIHRALGRETDGGLGVESAARLYDLLQPEPMRSPA